MRIGKYREQFKWNVHIETTVATARASTLVGGAVLTTRVLRRPNPTPSPTHPLTREPRPELGQGPLVLVVSVCGILALACVVAYVARAALCDPRRRRVADVPEATEAPQPQGEGVVVGTPVAT